MNKNKGLTLSILFIIQLSIINCSAQTLSNNKTYTHADTLRGSNGEGRNWWDVKKYEINVKFNFEDSTIQGTNIIEFEVISKGLEMQIDLQEPLIFDSYRISYDKLLDLEYGEPFFPQSIRKEKNAYFLKVHPAFIKAKKRKIYLRINYHGKPTIAKRPPWDGGLIWKLSKDGSPWVSIACQGLGASVWYPCKDYQGDEPDEGSTLSVYAPSNLTVVGNGKFGSTVTPDTGNIRRTTWEVKNPINNYNMIPYIGKYNNFSETYKGEKGNLDVNYWVLEENVEKAKEQFKDVQRMLKAFEHWFGPYPFYEDGYKIVESPHLGMEHQSAIAYGNGFQNGYRGRDLSATGWGLKWDFIIVHESGHEWFGNNITTVDIADMWVHESFTNYSETLFTDYYYGKDAGNAYCQGTRKLIQNDKPIIGSYGVNKEGSGDMYYKGGNMIHTIRQVISDDEKFRQILRGLNKTFYHKTVTTKQIEDYISKQSKIDFSKVFDEYLRTTKVPELQYWFDGKLLKYKWDHVVAGFKMPLKININDKDIWIKPTEQWQSIVLDSDTKPVLKVDPNFYVMSKEVKE